MGHQLNFQEPGDATASKNAHMMLFKHSLPEEIGQSCPVWRAREALSIKRVGFSLSGQVGLVTAHIGLSALVQLLQALPLAAHPCHSLAL